MVELKSLSAGYEGRPLIENISLKLNSGEVLVLMGPNGSGKSTLIRTILGQQKIIDGSVFFDGKDMREFNKKELAKVVSAVLTTTTRTEYMTGYDVVSQGRYPYGNSYFSDTAEDKEAVYGAFQFLGIEELEDKNFSTMSDGQKQLVMIARAIAQDTKVMILDEPENHLDIRYKLVVISALKKLALEKNKTIILSLHDISFVKKIADKILMIDVNHKIKYLDNTELLQENTIKDLFCISDDMPIPIGDIMIL